MRTSSIKRIRRGLVCAAGVLGAVLAASGAAKAEVIQICDRSGNCTVLHGVPPCEEWGLAQGSTCINIYALTVLGGFDDPAGRGHVGVLDAPGGAVLAVLTDESGSEAGRARLLDLSPYTERGPLGVGAQVREDGAALMLDIELSVLDPGTFEVREVLVESVDVSAIAFGAACPADVNGDARLNIRDFVAYQGMFRRSDPLADFDKDGRLTINDFIAFRAAFGSGCR